MGEAILVKTGGGKVDENYDPNDKYITSWELKTELITSSKEYTVPKAKNQQFSVRIFGGGGGMGVSSLPAGSGNMNNGEFKLNRGDIIPIIIGGCGQYGTEAINGGTTTFGTYLSATGGEAGDKVNGHAGNGGVGGCAYMVGEAKSSSWSLSNLEGVNAGISTYGGGSGGVYLLSNNFGYRGSNGGTYGGGGATYPGDPVKTGGKGCGNGGNGVLKATNGTNTVGTLLEFTGYGMTNESYGNYSGGGGYGGNGGAGVFFFSKHSDMNSCAGGGGYGASGGVGRSLNSGSTSYTNWYHIFGGYGGGYGGSNGGYGKSEYGRGYTGYQGAAALNGICIITYYAPIYNGT